MKLLCGQETIYITMKSELKCSISDGEGNNLIDDDVLSGNTIVGYNVYIGSQEKSSQSFLFLIVLRNAITPLTSS